MNKIIEMKILFIGSLLVLSLVSVAHTFAQDGSPSGTITGQLLDRKTQQPLIGVNTLILGTNKGASTDVEGRFILSDVPVGTFTLRFSYIGYRTMSRGDIVVHTGKPTHIVVEMEEQAVELSGEVVVTGSLFYTPKEMATSTYGMNYEEIRRQPGAVGDVSRMIQTMPGVVPTNDQRNDLVVRGGSPTENLTLVDNIEVPNISHFGTQGASGGPINMISTEFIREANFSAGGFPARYGDRLSSVLDIRLREGNREGLSGTFDLSMAGAGFLLEGPTPGEGSWMISARKSYLDLLFDDFGLTAVPNYSNYQAKIVVDAGESHKLWLVSLGGIDDIHFEPDFEKKDDPEVLDIRSGGWRSTTGLNWRWLWGTAGYGTFSISDVFNEYEQSARDPRETGSPLLFNNESTEGQTLLKYDAVFQLSRSVELTAGFRHAFIRADLLLETPDGNNNPYSTDSTRIPRPTISREVSTGQSGAYMQSSFTAFEELELTVGARYDNYALTNTSVFSPRAALSYHLLPNLTLSGSWGIFRQQPAMVLLSGHPQNGNLEPIRAEHVIAGISFYPQSDLKISLEAYRKEYSRYPVSTEFPTFSLANDGDSYTVNGRLIPLSSEGSGYATGIEFYLQKKLSDRVYGQISYTLSRSRHKALDGIERRGSFDIPHVLYIVGGYRLSEAWEFSTKFSYATGRPRTPFLMPESAQQNRWIYDVNSINTLRMPDYHRLDLRVDNRHNFSGWDLVAYVELQNIYSRRNVFTYLWNEKTGDEEAVYQIGLFFVGGVKIEF